MSSSLRNAVKRKTHKERAQPNERKRFGLLEKHKDYKLRARDFHRKEDAIKVLRNKAALRNPDEFYFAMETARTRDGVHLASSTQKTHSAEELRLMKTQDAGYVVMKAQAEAKKVERLSASLHRVDAPAVGRRTVFVDDGDEAVAITQRAVADAPHADEEEEEEEEGIPRSARRSYRELEQRRERLGKLQAVSREMAAQKTLQGKGRKQKVGGAEGGEGGAAVYRWKAERKR